MSYGWTDTYDIAIQLFIQYPHIDPMELRFTELHSMVCQLPDFKDDPNRSNEKILEAIQMAWLEEVQE